jgi:hypothetical protein
LEFEEELVRSGKRDLVGGLFVRHTVVISELLVFYGGATE